MMYLQQKLKDAPLLVQERQESYGHPEDDFRRVATMTRPLGDCDDPRLRHILYMICVKICRLIQTPDHEDSWVDIVGYCYTAALILDKREGEAESDD